MEFFYQRLESAMKKCNIAPSELARQVGVSAASISLILNGKANSVKFDVAIKICKVLKINPMWLAEGAPYPESLDAPAQKPTGGNGMIIPEYRVIPNTTGDGQPCKFATYPFSYTAFAVTNRFMKERGLENMRLAVFRMVGDAMTPLINDGALILCELNLPTLDQLHYESNSIMVYADLQSYTVFCRYLYVDDQGQHIILRSVNDGYDDLIYPLHNNEIYILGRFKCCMTIYPSHY